MYKGTAGQVKRRNSGAAKEEAAKVRRREKAKRDYERQKKKEEKERKEAAAGMGGMPGGMPGMGGHGRHCRSNAPQYIFVWRNANTILSKV